RPRYLPREGNAPEVGDIAAEQEPEGATGRGHHAAEGQQGRPRLRGHLFVEPGEGQWLPRALESVHEEEKHERRIGPAREKSRPDEGQSGADGETAQQGRARRGERGDARR